MRDDAPIIIVIAILLFGGIALIMFNNRQDGRLDDSVIGLNGLAVWLEENDIAIRKSHPRLSPNNSDFTLRILPLYDVDIFNEAVAPKDTGELYDQQTQRDLESELFEIKTLTLPSIVLLPKWTTGFIESGIAHEQTLIPIDRYSLLFEQVGLPGVELQRQDSEFASFMPQPDGMNEVALFHAQTFVAGSLPDVCKPEVKLDRDVLIMSCRLAEQEHDTYFVADPDLLNNHGLSLAANAGFAIEFVSRLMDGNGGQIYLDSSPYLLMRYDEVDEERRDYSRSATDLARFFDYPLSILWAVALFVLAVLFWRGAVKFGPLERDHDPSINQAKTVAIQTKARLLRLSESDGEMVADFIRNQLMDLISQTLGSDLGEAGQKRYFAHLSRRNAGLAAAFQQSSENLVLNAGKMPHAELFRNLNTYNNLLEKVVHDNGSIGISKTR